MPGEIRPGDRVGVRYRDPHPHRGEVLSRDDPAAWRGTIAFPCYAHGPDRPCSGACPLPDAEAVKRHVAWCDRIHAVHYAHESQKVPVAWDFGRVYWEDPDSLFHDYPSEARLANR